MIEDWYRHHQTEDLSQFLCADRVLKGKDASKSLGLPGAVHACESTGNPARARGALRVPQAPLSPCPGCLAEKWTGKKGDLASAGEKSSKKKSGKKKKKAEKGQSEGAESFSPEESGVQEATPLPHSPTDEL